MSRVRLDSLLVADSSTNRILRIKGDSMSLVAGNGISGYRDGGGAQAEFRQPEGLAVSTDGAIYVADANNHCIRMLR
jgi:hypothetical protein